MNFIKVSGEASYKEEPIKWIIDLIITIRAAKEETIMNDSTEYNNTVITILKENNIKDDEIFYAGKEVYIPWWKKKSSGINVSNTITIITNDRYKAYKALDKVHKLQKIQRVNFEVNEREPIFQANNNDIILAQKEACNNAKNKAEILANEFDRNIGTVIEITELNKSYRGSGNIGDYDFYGPYAVTAAASSATLEEDNYIDEIELKGNERITFIQYEFKFELI